MAFATSFKKEPLFLQISGLAFLVPHRPHA